MREITFDNINELRGGYRIIEDYCIENKIAFSYSESGLTATFEQIDSIIDSLIASDDWDDILPIGKSEQARSNFGNIKSRMKEANNRNAEFGQIISEFAQLNNQGNANNLNKKS